MYEFINNGQVIATADAPEWLEYLYVKYPNGRIIERPQPAPVVDQPVVNGAQTL